MGNSVNSHEQIDTLLDAFNCLLLGRGKEAQFGRETMRPWKRRQSWPKYTSNDGKLLLDILYRINQTEDIVSFGKTALFFIRTYRNFSSGMFFSLKALNNDVIIDTAVFDDDKPPSRFDQFLNGRYDNDKLLKAMTAASDSCAFRDEDLFGQKELLKSDLYRNFITPEGFRYVARIELMDGSTPIGQFVLLNTAEEGDFDNGFIGLCNTLAKHLSLKARQLQRAAEVTSLGLSKAPEELKRLYGLSDRECESPSSSPTGFLIEKYQRP